MKNYNLRIPKKFFGAFFITFLTANFILIGCTKPYQATKIISDKNFSEGSNNVKKGESPNLGIAISGGGSKASPFVMGVLKRFVDNGWIKNVDIISSVSGGSYSAYYLYNKAIHIDQYHHKYPDRNLTYFFKNCELDKMQNVTTWQEYNKTKDEICQDNYGVKQQHVKNYQDLLSYFKSVDARGGSSFDEIKKVGIASEVLISSAITAPFHHVSNSLFDWRIELSPSQYKYNRGIIRAYGNNIEETNSSFENLKRLTDDNKVPLWIINTTNFKSSWWLDTFTRDDENLSKSIFEITPYGFGSGRYGYTQDSPDNISLNLPRATLASSAFLDALGDKGYQGYLFAALHGLNLRWGIQVPNYNYSTTRQKLHNLYPFPFYYFDGDVSKITLADGGQSGDNLGLYALIKRNVQNIIILSASNDSNDINDSDEGHQLKMEDMCSVSKFLANKNLKIIFEGNPTTKEKNELDFNKTFCGKHATKLSYYKWKEPVWKGYIRDMNDVNISKLYFLKASIDKKDLTQNGRAFNQNGSCKEKNKDARGKQKDALFKCTNQNKYVVTNSNYPNSLLSFWQLGTWGEKVSNFPQTSTIMNTLTSSSGLYQAYMDLGFYLSGYLIEEDELMNIMKDEK